MDSTTQKLVILLTAVCVLSVVNVVAALLGVPIVTATIADGISLLLAFGGMLLGVKALPEKPKDPPNPPTA